MIFIFLINNNTLNSTMADALQKFTDIINADPVAQYNWAQICGHMSVVFEECPDIPNLLSTLMQDTANSDSENEIAEKSLDGMKIYDSNDLETKTAKLILKYNRTHPAMSDRAVANLNLLVQFVNRLLTNNPNLKSLIADHTAHAIKSGFRFDT